VARALRPALNIGNELDDLRSNDGDMIENPGRHLIDIGHERLLPWFLVIPCGKAFAFRFTQSSGACGINRAAL
jgi:hypothetical protein